MARGFMSPQGQSDLQRNLSADRPTQSCSAGNGCYDLNSAGAALLLTKINWGIGMIAMPFYLHSAGLGAGVIFFLLSMLLAADAALVLQQLQNSGDPGVLEASYVLLIGRSLGRAGETLAVLSLIVANWGSAVAWLKFIGDNLARFLPLGISSAGWVLILVGPVALSALVDEIAALQRLSRLGLLAGQLFVLLIAIRVIPHLHNFPEYLAAEPFLRLKTFPVAMGLAVFCNEGLVVLSPSVAASMQKPKLLSWSLFLAVTFFSLNYMLLAICGDFLYSYLQNGEVAQEVTMSQGFEMTVLHRVAVLCYVLQLLLTFPASLFVLFRNFEALHPCYGNCWKRAWRSAAVLTVGAVAVVVPRFGDFLAVAGAVGNSVCIYILPHLALLAEGTWRGMQLSKSRRVLSWIIVLVFGAFCGGLASVISIQKLVA